MVDPLEATVLCSGSHHIKCCIEEDGDYKVTFHMGSLSLPAGKMLIAELLEYIISHMWSLKIYS